MFMALNKRETNPYFGAVTAGAPTYRNIGAATAAPAAPAPTRLLKTDPVYKIFVFTIFVGNLLILISFNNTQY